MFASFSPLTRRILAVSLLLLALLLLATAVIEPLVRMAGQAVEQLADARFEQNRLKAIAALPPVDENALQQRRQRLLASVMTAQDEAQAMAALQSQLSALFSGAGLTMNNTRRVPVDAEGAISLVAVSTEVTGPERAWLDSLEAIETSKPLLVIQRMEVSAPETSAHDRQLRGQLTIAAVWMQPEASRP